MRRWCSLWGASKQWKSSVRRPRELPAAWPGYWNPSVATGPDGRATVQLTMPDDTANVSIVAKAITADTLAGQAVKKLALNKNLRATIQLPAAFTDGDEVELPVIVDNQVLDRGSLEVALNMNVDGDEWNEKKTIEVKSRGPVETSFKTTVRQLQRPLKESGSLSPRPEAILIVTVKAGGQSDVCRRTVPILPYGMPCRVTATGVASGEAKVSIAPGTPTGRPQRSASRSARISSEAC